MVQLSGSATKRHGFRFLICISSCLTLSLVAPSLSAWAWTDGEVRFAKDVQALGMAAPGVRIDQIVQGGRDICTELGAMPGSVIAENLYQAVNQPGVKVAVTRVKTEAVVKSAARNLCPGSWW